MQDEILNDFELCLKRFNKETCNKYFYQKVTVGEIYSKLLMEREEAKLSSKNSEKNNKAEVDKPEALTMNITNMNADGTVEILFSEFIKPLSAYNLTLD